MQHTLMVFTERGYHSTCSPFFIFSSSWLSGGAINHTTLSAWTNISMRNANTIQAFSHINQRVPYEYRMSISSRFLYREPFFFFFYWNR